MKAATSPVNAPSFCSAAQFCAATLMFEPSSRSATLFKAVKTGAMTISQRFALATSGFRATAVATESATVLYIFQFPAITGLRMIKNYCRRSGHEDLLADIDDHADQEISCPIRNLRWQPTNGICSAFVRQEGTR